MQVQIEWKGGLVFEATPPSGNRFSMDGHADGGGEDRGPTPVEALISALGACTAMDVISILEKKRQAVTAYQVEIEYERAPEGTWPRPVTSATIRHIVTGSAIDSESVQRAVQLSDEKYCSVSATLRNPPAIRNEWKIVQG